MRSSGEIVKAGAAGCGRRCDRRAPDLPGERGAIISCSTRSVCSSRSKRVPVRPEHSPCRTPGLGALAEGGRVVGIDVRAADDVGGDGRQEPLGVDPSCERLLPLPAVRVASSSWASNQADVRRVIAHITADPAAARPVAVEAPLVARCDPARRGTRRPRGRPPGVRTARHSCSVDPPDRGEREGHRKGLRGRCRCVATDQLMGDHRVAGSHRMILGRSGRVGRSRGAMTTWSCVSLSARHSRRSREQPPPSTPLDYPARCEQHRQPAPRRWHRRGRQRRRSAARSGVRAGSARSQRRKPSADRR